LQVFFSPDLGGCGDKRVHCAENTASLRLVSTLAKFKRPDLAIGVAFTLGSLALNARTDEANYDQTSTPSPIC
jgi:hypothetical protein